jgi:3-oxoadipate enol-lactonase
LLLVAGQALSRRGWDSVVDDFAAHHLVVVFDHRGTGNSDAPTHEPYTTRGFARDAIAVLDAAGIERAHAYGHSMGGRICQWLGIDHPHRLGALVLGATTPGDSQGIPRSSTADAALRSKDPDQFLHLLFSPKWAAAHPEAVAAIVAPPQDATQLGLHYAASQSHDAWDMLPSISAATLVLHGSADQVNPPGNAQLLAERIPNARLHFIPGARHGYYSEHPEATSIVLDFLARHPLSR